MGASSSVLFKYKNHCLVKRRDNKFFWVYYKDGKAMTSMEVAVEMAVLNPQTTFDQMLPGPLIYRSENDSSYQVMSEDYVPTLTNLSYQLKEVSYYKLTQAPVWSKIFYVRS